MKIISLILVTCSFFFTQKIDKADFYVVLESDSESKISAKIATLDKLNTSKDKDAYIGTLTMKHSKFMKTPKEKIAVFRSGKDMLEKSIRSAPNNGEYRFLRLIIQENSPKILKYNSNIEEDIKIIQETFNSLDGLVKKVIKSYASGSKNLSAELLK